MYYLRFLLLACFSKANQIFIASNKLISIKISKCIFNQIIYLKRLGLNWSFYFIFLIFNKNNKQ